MTGQRNTLIEHMNAQGLNVPYSDELDIYNTPLSVYGKTISNRIGIQPLEGFDSDMIRYQR